MQDNNRVYYTKADLKTTKIIRTKPFFMLHRDFNEVKVEDTLKCFCYNTLFKSLIGLKYQDNTEPAEGFQGLEWIYSKDWMSFYEKYLIFYMDLTKTSLDLTENELMIIPEKNSYHIPGYFTVYKQVYLDTNSCLIAQFYFVFNEKTESEMDIKQEA